MASLLLILHSAPPPPCLDALARWGLGTLQVHCLVGRSELLTVINGYFAIWNLQVSLAHCLELNYLSGCSFLELDSLSAYLSVGMALTSMPAHPSFFSVCSFNTIFHPFYTLVYPQRYEQSDLDMNAMQNLLANSMAVFEGWFRRCCSRCEL